MNLKLLWSFLLLLIAGCTPAPVEPVRLGTNVWAGYEPLYLARSLGWLDEPNVKLVEFTSTTSVLRAMRDHTLEVAAMTLDEALLLYQDDPNIRIVLVMDESSGADAILARSGIGSLQELKGKRVAAETTALGAYMISRAMDVGQLQPGDLTIISIPANEHTAAYKSGSVDAVVTFEPVKSELKRAGAQVIFDSARIPSEVVDVLVVHDNVLESNRDRLEQLIAAWFRALDYLTEHPNDAAKRMQPRLKLSVKEVLAQYEGLRLPDLNENLAVLSGGNESRLFESSQKMAEMMINKRLIHKFPENDIMDASLLHAMETTR
ncbi:NitT/TauT family transport system substrate-binding protein [Mariprofundus micogutta]|uniref:NitT/TauT family transport system substrate-binding protein n=2 Tax=Mariprofundus micogutta TaxID=1921010 RepID=A0A1L8CN93_9PROT|nr:NitT/TauT family transport system substrate-binding protein [Mariprofundus micogutta]